MLLCCYRSVLQVLGGPGPGSAQGGASASSHSAADSDSNSDDGEGKYSLMAVISHLGKNTDHGHYVCHVKKDSQWVLFNDEKVQYVLYVLMLSYELFLCSARCFPLETCSCGCSVVRCFLTLYLMCSVLCALCSVFCVLYRQVGKCKRAPLEHGFMYLYRRDDGPGTFAL